MLIFKNFCIQFKYWERRKSFEINSVSLNSWIWHILSVEKCNFNLIIRLTTRLHFLKLEEFLKKKDKLLNILESIKEALEIRLKNYWNFCWWENSHMSSTFYAMLFVMALTFYGTTARSKTKRVKTRDWEIQFIYFWLFLDQSIDIGMPDGVRRLFQNFYLFCNVLATRIFENLEKFAKATIITLNSSITH